MQLLKCRVATDRRGLSCVRDIAYLLDMKLIVVKRGWFWRNTHVMVIGTDDQMVKLQEGLKKHGKVEEY